MLYAAIRIAPVFGGQLQSCDTAAVEKLPGVSKVVKLSNAVAVVADNWYRANKAVAQLEPVFTDNGAGKVDSAAIAAAQAQALDSASAEPAVKKGDVAPALASAANKVVKARYAVPFLAHATLEPMNATVQFKDGKLDLWTSVQDPLNALYIAKGQLDLDAENVTMHHRHVGGGFGRRLAGQFDFVEQAVAIARECAPTAVKLIWSREQDMTHGYFRPAVTAELSGALDASGQLLAWKMRCAGSGAGGAGNPPYNVANLERIDLPASNHVRTGPWRSVGHSIHGFTIESFADELAVAAGKDPVEFRRELLQQDPRSLAVLDRVAKMAQWGVPLPESRFRGVALVNSFGSYVAEVAEIEVIRGATGQPLGLRVPRVWAAVDCGIVVNPMTAQQQIEGGIVFGLSAALGESITVEGGAVKQANFNQYDLLRMPDAPQVEVEFITSDAAPGGLGEPGTPPIAAAVANAWFAATGQRLRELPLRLAIEAAAGR
jgi:isoquinoline 1-oxidoreductase beta subunit